MVLRDFKMILEISNGEIRKPKSNLNVVFKDDKKAMEDMSRLGEEYNKNPSDRPAYKVIIELLEINKDNIEENIRRKTFKMNFDDIISSIELEIENRIDRGYDSDELYVSNDIFMILKNYKMIHNMPIILDNKLPKGCFNIRET